MPLSGLRFVMLFLFMGRAYAGFGVESYSPADTYIIPQITYLCENTEPSEDFYAELRNINDNGDKVFNMEIDLQDAQFTEKWTVKVVIDKWNNGGWDENFFIMDGLACEIAVKYSETIWENFKKEMMPTITDKCFAELGHYKLTDFKVNRTDINIPINIVGKYRVILKLFNGTGEEVLCQVFEAEVRKP
ncbi:uncharacterized protein LOC108907416 [Anoplophora glabripennis]|uniref:uncharacterized protein LOC108907416 n=1 Tax=Anoplophora glabripennis TaxID=217634 RepID=UPI000873DD6F|nr:uncharacterized protein LOC108907416 [Anoplophora glabripennis]